MSFFEEIGFIETEAQERARLAQYPKGSLFHHLSTLPIRIEGWPKDLLVRLPWNAADAETRYTVVVVPIEYHRYKSSAGEEERLPRRRHTGWWTCAVVYSDDPNYPAGGRRLSIDAAEIARGATVSAAGLPGSES